MVTCVHYNAMPSTSSRAGRRHGRPTLPALPRHSGGCHGTGGACQAEMVSYTPILDSWLGAEETARCNVTSSRVHSTYQSPLAVGVVRKQVLARQRQVVGPDAVAWRLSLLHDTVLSAPLPVEVELLWRQRQQGRATPPVLAPTWLFSPVCPQHALNEVLAILCACKRRSCLLLLIGRHVCGWM